MPKTSSVNKAQWSATREEFYYKECEKILFDKGLEIKLEDQLVYLLSPENDLEYLLQISKPKTIWYEIWLKIKNI